MPEPAMALRDTVPAAWAASRERMEKKTRCPKATRAAVSGSQEGSNG